MTHGTMHSLKSFLRAMLLGASAVMLAGCSLGEWAVDVYGGPNFPTNETVSAIIDGDPIEGIADFDGDVTVGARAAYFFTPFDLLHLGLALDVSGAWQEVGNFEFTSVPVSLLPMVRLPLFKSEAFPGGRLQPYIGVGPSLIWSGVDQVEFTGDSYDLGLDARGGLAFMFVEHLGIFAEYRFTYYQPEFTQNDPIEIRTQFDSLNSHILVGVTLRF